MFNFGAWIARNDIGNRMRPTLIANKKRVTLGKITRIFSTGLNANKTTIAILRPAGRKIAIVVLFAFNPVLKMRVILPNVTRFLLAISVGRIRFPISFRAIQAPKLNMRPLPRAFPKTSFFIVSSVASQPKIRCR